MDGRMARDLTAIHVGGQAANAPNAETGANLYPIMRSLKYVARLVVALVLIYGVLSAGLYAAMLQPPETFGAIMSRVPTLAMMVLPFRPLWMSARGGVLQVGDQAPDFTLPPLHGDTNITLSSEYAKRPVVLVFGSYT